jgi:hypothetical protein
VRHKDEHDRLWDVVCFVGVRCPTRSKQRPGHTTRPHVNPVHSFPDLRKSIAQGLPYFITAGRTSLKPYQLLLQAQPYQLKPTFPAAAGAAAGGVHFPHKEPPSAV